MFCVGYNFFFLLFSCFLFLQCYLHTYFTTHLHKPNIYTNCQLPHGFRSGENANTVVLHFRRKSVPTAQLVSPFCIDMCFRFHHIGSSVNLILFAFGEWYGDASLCCAYFFFFFFFLISLRFLCLLVLLFFRLASLI